MNFLTQKKWFAQHYQRMVDADYLMIILTNFILSEAVKVKTKPTPILQIMSNPDLNTILDLMSTPDLNTILEIMSTPDLNTATFNTKTNRISYKRQQT